MGIECNLTCMVMIFFTSSSLHLIVCQQLKLSMCAVCQSMLSCPKQKKGTGLPCLCPGNLDQDQIDVLTGVKSIGK